MRDGYYRFALQDWPAQPAEHIEARGGSHRGDDESGVRRRINRLALIEIGDISWPEHVSIFTVPVRMAVQTQGAAACVGRECTKRIRRTCRRAENNVLDRSWLEEFGGLLGLRVSDFVGLDGITRRDLVQYHYPSDEELRSVGVTGIFLGYYFPWDGYQNALIAQGHGFETFRTTVEGSLANYENLDNCSNWHPRLLQVSEVWFRAGDRHRK